MPSQSISVSVTGSSLDGHSIANDELNPSISDTPVPELDNDISTDDFTSDYLSTTSTSILGQHHLLEPDHNGTLQYDAVSVYSPSRYPSVSAAYRTERPFGDRETLNSTRSINELDLDYVTENGRRYCGSYYMPNDDDEQVRLQLINQVYLKAFDGELTSIPLETPTHILDIGTAVGEWAIDMAEAFPECEVTGTDISNIFERQAPQNVFWEIDDAELDWERPSDHYDLVHLRNMAGSFADWESIYRSALKCLKPGGWVEILDFDDHRGMRNFFSFFEPGSLMHKVARDLQEASVISGRPRGVEHLEPRFLVNAGYVDVQLVEHAIPLRTQDGSTGKFWLLAMLNGIEPTCLRLLTKYKGWDPDDVRMACDMIGEEMMTMALNPKRARGFVVKVRVLVGRKPGQQVRWSTAPISESGEVMRRSIPGGTEGGSALADGESGYGSFGRSRAHSEEEHKLSRSSLESRLVEDSETVSADGVSGRGEPGLVAYTEEMESHSGTSVDYSEDGRENHQNRIDQAALDEHDGLTDRTMEDTFMGEAQPEASMNVIEPVPELAISFVANGSGVEGSESESTKATTADVAMDEARPAS